MKFKKVFILILLIGVAVVAYKYCVHPVVLRTLFPHKIWPHRVNSIAKLQETSMIFSGMELDVVWEGDRFDVNHPPAQSIRLYLTEYLEHLPQIEQYGLWIDYKNLGVNGALDSAEHLDSLLRKNNLNKNRIYVESRFPQFLAPFQEKGYKVSYYLPSGLNKIQNKDSLEKVINLINSDLEKTPDLFISAPFADYDFMEKHFPKKKKLLWHLGRLSGPANRFKIYRTLLDENVEVILLPFISKTGDR